MIIVNGVYMNNFTEEEFPPYIAKYISRLILSRVQIYRDVLKHPFSISKASGALVRFEGRETSEHFVKVDHDSGKILKYSRAVDGFPGCNIFKAWTTALSCGLFSGVGVYFDTRNNHGLPQPMLHLDLRSNPLIWYRHEGKYFYPKDKDFYKNLNILLGEPDND